MLRNKLISNLILGLFLAFFINLAFFHTETLSESGCKSDISPMCVVKVAVNQILDLLKNKELSKEQKREKIRAIIYEHFDFSEMAKRILARHWRKLTPEQKKTFTDLLAQLLETSYRNKIENYSDEKVLFKKQRIKKHLARVYTIIKTKQEEIPVTYSLIRKNGKWVIYDVKVEDVSMVSNYRATYAEIIKKEGFDGLIAKMREKIKQLSAQQNQKNAALIITQKGVVL